MNEKIINKEDLFCVIGIGFIEKTKEKTFIRSLTVNLFNLDDINKLETFLTYYSKEKDIQVNICVIESCNEKLSNSIMEELEDKTTNFEKYTFLKYIYQKFEVLLTAELSKIVIGALLFFAGKLNVVFTDLIYFVWSFRYYCFVEDKEEYRNNKKMLGEAFAEEAWLNEELERENAIECFDFEKYADIKLKEYQYIKGYGYYKYIEY